MRNILDKVHRELAVTKTLTMEEKELRRLLPEEENEAMVHSLRGGHDSDQDNNKSIVASTLNDNQDRRLRGGSKNEQQPLQMLAKEDDSPPEDAPLAFNRDSAMFEPFSDLDPSFFILDDNATISADHNNVTAIGNNGIANSNHDHQLDVGAWLLMVLIVGSAVFGLVTYRSSPRRGRRRGSNNNGAYQYKGVMLPTLDEDDWGD